MNSVRVDNESWNYVFLAGGFLFNDADKQKIMSETIRMYKKDATSQRIRGEECEGVITTERRYQVLGQFSGQRFDGEFDTDYGSAKFSILVSDAMVRNIEKEMTRH